mgnify:CR=1 FL=1
MACWPDVPEPIKKTQSAAPNGKNRFGRAVCVRGLLRGVVGGGHLLDGGDQTRQILHVAGDDELGGTAVGNLGQRFQTLQSQHLVVGGGFVQQAQRVGQSLLHLQNGLRFTLGLTDALLAHRVRPQNGAFLFAFGLGDGGGLFAFRNQNGFALQALGFICFSMAS